MKKKYVSLCLAAVLSLSQMVGTSQLVHASEISAETELGKEEGGDATTSKQMLEAGERLIETEQLPVGEEIPVIGNQLPDGEEVPAGTNELPEEEGMPADAETLELENMIAPVAENIQQEESYQPFFSLPDEMRILQGNGGYISKMNSGVWQLLSGTMPAQLPMEITKVISGDTEIIEAVEAEDGGGWNLAPKKVGKTNVTVTGKAITEGMVSPDEATKALEASKTIQIIVSEKTYRVEIVNQAGINKVFPGSFVTLTANVFEESMGENGWEDKKITDADVAWKATSLNNRFQPITGTGETFVIQVPESDAYDNIDVTAEVKAGGETVASLTYYLEVVNEYYSMELKTSEGIENIWIGEEATVEPVVYCHKKGQEDPTIVKNVQYQFQNSAPESFEIWKGQTKVEEDGEYQEGGIFTIKKVKNVYGTIYIQAYSAGASDEYVEFLDSEKIDFQTNNYSEISIEGGQGEWSAMLFVDDENPDENDEDTEFTLNTEKIKGKYEIEWSLEYNSYIIDTGNTNICKISPDKKSITINPKALKDDLVANQGNTEGDYFYCNLGAIVKIEGEEQGSTYKDIVIMKPYYGINNGEWQIFSGSVITYQNGKIDGYVTNKNYPDGGEITLSLKDVKVLEQKPENENTNVLTVKKEGNNILLVAENPGWVNLEYLVVLPNGKEMTVQDDKSVVKDKYQFSIKSSTGTTDLLPNAKLKLEPEVRHGFYDAAAQSERWEKLAPEKYTVTYDASGSEEICTVSTDGTVQAKEAYGEGCINVKCVIPQADSEPLEEYDEIFIYVTDSYYQVSAKEIYAAPGETVNAVEWEWKTFDLEHRDGKIETNFTYQLRGKTGITLNTAETGFTVNADAADGNKITILATLSKEDTDGHMMRAMASVILNICKHNFTQTAVKPATCTEAGNRTLECSKCHHASKTETIAAVGHKPGNLATVKQAACTVAGTQEKKCTVCGKVMETKTIPATGHSFGAWKETKKPTALKQGTQARTCKTCSAVETKSTAKLKATIKLNTKKIPLQVKKSTTAVKVVSMTKGDSIKSWKSNNKKVATVTSKGKITGKKVGTAKITVTLKSGISATVTVKVQKKAVTTTKLTVTGKSVKKNKLTLKKGKSVTLTTVRTPVTSTEKITYKSSNKKIATVSGKGKITAKKVGKANITVKSGKKKVVIKVTVKK